MGYILSLLYRSVLAASAYALNSILLWHLFGVDFKISLVIFTPSIFALAQSFSWVSSDVIPAKIEFVGYVIATILTWKLFLCHISENCDLFGF